jgi:serine/threonine-protein kinase RsbW
MKEINLLEQQVSECFRNQNFEEMEKYVSFITPDSDDLDSGNALFAVFNDKRNCVAVVKHFQKRRHSIKLKE